jgi:hypothetical protein
MRPFCQNCRFYAPLDDKQGSCRIRAPKAEYNPDGSLTSFYPPVSYVGRCGEHQQKPFWWSWIGRTG